MRALGVVFPKNCYMSTLQLHKVISFGMIVSLHSKIFWNLFSWLLQSALIRSYFSQEVAAAFLRDCNFTDITVISRKIFERYLLGAPGNGCSWLSPFPNSPFWNNQPNFVTTSPICSKIVPNKLFQYFFFFQYFSCRCTRAGSRVRSLAWHFARSIASAIVAFDPQSWTKCYRQLHKIHLNIRFSIECLRADFLKLFAQLLCYVASWSLAFKDTQKAFDDFNNKQQKCMKWYFLISKVIYSESYIYSFFSRDFQLISFTFKSPFLHELKHKVNISETVFRIFHFRFRLDFTKVYIFVQQKSMDSLNLKRHKSFQN